MLRCKSIILSFYFLKREFTLVHPCFYLRLFSAWTQLKWLRAIPPADISHNNFLPISYPPPTDVQDRRAWFNKPAAIYRKIFPFGPLTWNGTSCDSIMSHWRAYSTSINFNADIIEPPQCLKKWSFLSIACGLRHGHFLSKFVCCMNSHQVHRPGRVWQFSRSIELFNLPKITIVRWGFIRLSLCITIIEVCTASSLVVIVSL